MTNMSEVVDNGWSGRQHALYSQLGSTAAVAKLVHRTRAAGYGAHRLFLLPSAIDAHACRRTSANNW